MSKAILIVDIPKSCDDCQLKVLESDLFYTTYACQNATCETEDILKTTKYEMNCPLKPLPKIKQKIKELPQYTKEYEAYCKGEVDGWNLCLDEILGGDLL